MQTSTALLPVGCGRGSFYHEDAVPLRHSGLEDVIYRHHQPGAKFPVSTYYKISLLIINFYL